MLSNQVLQKTIHEMGNILECNCSLWNERGELLASVGLEKTFVKQSVRAFLQSPEELEKGCVSQKECTLFPVKNEEELIYILVLELEKSDEVSRIGRLCVSQLQSLLEMNQEKMDKNRFVQKVMLNHLTEIEIYNQAKRLGIPVEQKRAVFLIEPKGEQDEVILEMVRGIYTTGMGDYVTAVDNGHVILVKSLETDEDMNEADEIAHMLVSIMNTEAMVNVRVSYGSLTDKLQQITSAYQEAKIAMEVGRIFYVEKEVLAYQELGIGRLIHQLPESLCEMFLKEVFDEQEENIFDEEILSTVNQFFENNLNISETARQLYVHRNTLVHRLERIQKLTGLDVRMFEDALTLKIALMVSDQVKYTKLKNRK